MEGRPSQDTFNIFNRVVRGYTRICCDLARCLHRQGDDGLDWLEAANATLSAGEDCGFSAFMAKIDGMVMGRARLRR